MRWSARVARVGGTDLRVHLTFPFLLAWVAIGAGMQGGAAAAAEGVGLVLLVFGSVVLHELGHVAAARRFGIETSDVTLLPIGGVARMQRIPREPWQELVIALAGPAVTFLIAAGLFAVVGAPGAAGAAGLPGGPAPSMAQQVMLANAMLLAFNLLPAFPMDGGRVLRAVLAVWMDYAGATRVAGAVGQLFAVLFGIVGLFGNPILVLVGIFVYLGARAEVASVELHGAAGRLPASAAMMTDFAVVPATATLQDAADALLAGAQRDLPVVGADGRLRGILARTDLLRALAGGGSALGVAEAMHTGVPAVREDEPLETALRVMEDDHPPVIAVVDAAERLVGLLTPENFAEMVLLRRLPAHWRRASWRGDAAGKPVGAGGGG